MQENICSINKSPGLANIKDLNSRFIAFSEGLAKLAGYKSVDAAIGKTDHDNPCGLADFAAEFIKLDKQVINNRKKMVTIDIQNYSTGWGIIMAEKIPIKNTENEITGVFSQLIDVSEIDMFKFYLKLHSFDTKWLGTSKKPACYLLTETYSPLPLTEKQENCLFYLIRGKTIKEIAKALLISPRTVECHVDAIKTKLNCYNKSAIIEKAIDMGFLFYIPKHFQQK